MFEDAAAAALEPVLGVGREVGAPALDRAAAGPRRVAPGPVDLVEAGITEQPDAEDQDDDIQAEGAAGDVVDGSIVERAPGGDVEPALLAELDESQAALDDREDPLGRGAVGVPAGAGTRAAVGGLEHEREG